MKVDLGCGPSKQEGYYGLDAFPYEGVDLVQDLNEPGWALEDASCEEINASHLVEHINDLVAFFGELHRIAADGCTVKLSTPHYTSRDSWRDPTHVHHLSVHFFDTLLEGYLRERMGAFEIVERRLSYGPFVFTWPARLVVALFGYAFYEEHCAWSMPARNIYLTLKCVK
jgi:hypothetical protein